jgi:hypothetical protein
MKELPRESLQFLKFRACDPIIRHKAAEVLDSRELVIWPEDVERPRRARAYCRRARGIDGAFAAWNATSRRVVERGRSLEGDRPSPTRLEPAHARGRARHRLRHAEGVGARERLGADTSRPVRSLTCGKACRKSARAFLPNSSNPSAQGSSGVRTSVRATFLRCFGLGRHARPPLCHPA